MNSSNSLKILYKGMSLVELDINMSDEDDEHAGGKMYTDYILYKKKGYAAERAVYDFTAGCFCTIYLITSYRRIVSRFDYAFSVEGAAYFSSGVYQTSNFTRVKYALADMQIWYRGIRDYLEKVLSRSLLSKREGKVLRVRLPIESSVSGSTIGSSAMIIRLLVGEGGRVAWINSVRLDKSYRRFLDRFFAAVGVERDIEALIRERLS